VDCYRQGNLLIHPELSGNPSSSHLVASQEGFGDGNDEFSLQNIFVHTSKLFLYASKSYDIWPTALFPSEGRREADFYRPHNSIAICKIQTRESWV
jgi:hypothetical protein